MKKKKYYAVKEGKIPGIYMTWEDCSKQVTGHKGAKYKSFTTIEEALTFIEETNLPIKKEKSKIKKSNTETPSTTKKDKDITSIRSSANVKVHKSYINPDEIKEKYTFIAFVDGSYDKTNKIFGSGVIVLNPDNNTHETYFNAGYDKWGQWNIVGELESVKVAIEKAKELGHKNIAIYHDLLNISLWASGEWKARNEYTQEYVRYIEEASSIIDICFIKVKAHSNESVYNDLADEAAKHAIVNYLEVKTK